MLWLISDVDTEFDSFRPDGKYGYNENLGLIEGVPQLLEFFDERNINASFHIQEQKNSNFSILEQHSEVYEMVEKYDQEISLHVHMKDEDYGKRKSEMEAAIERLRERDYWVSSFKSGWYFTNENTIKILSEFGIKFDCSPLKDSVVGPMRWYDIPDSPYHPDPENITKVGDSKVLIIPITSRRLGIGIHENDSEELELMKKGVRVLASKAEEITQPVILYFTTHSWKSIAPDGSTRNWVLDRRDDFFDFLEEYDYESLTVGEAGERWIRDNYEPYFLDLPDLVGRKRSVFNPLRHYKLVKHLLSKVYNLRYKITGNI